jgi:hypothetical protein
MHEPATTSTLRIKFTALFMLSLLLVACGGGGGVAAPGGIAVAPPPPPPGPPPPPPGTSPCDVSTGGCTVTWAIVADPRVTGYRVYIGFGAAIPVTVVNAQSVNAVAGQATLAFNFSVQSLAAQNAGFVANTLVSIAVSATGAGGSIESPLSAPVGTTI